VFGNIYLCEQFISKIKYNVNSGVETGFQMHICTTLSVLQHQAWN